MMIEFQRADWMAEAACRGMDTNLFIPRRGQDVPGIVKRTCESCPVRRQCADYAADDPRIVGYWGGRSGRERRIARTWRASA